MAGSDEPKKRRSLPDNIGGAPSMSRSDRQIDPLVWSGRVLQENFDELAVSGHASMYPAFDWSAYSWPSWISARVRPH
jgi:hypothetical protein